MEHAATFDCFGGTCTVVVAGDGPLGPAPQAVDAVRAQLLAWHAQLSRFQPGSELSRVNADPRATVPVSPVLARLAATVVEAAERSGGLVDATLVGELEAAGYASHRADPGRPLAAALHDAPARRPAHPDPRRRWATLRVDLAAGTITRPPGVRLDSGGLAKGLFADLLAERLAPYDAWLVSCCGDLRLGGAARVARAIEVDDPFDGSVAKLLRSSATAVATSGIGRRSWRDADGRPAHHLLDPATARPAFTGLVQVTALAPTAVEAEWHSTAALLTGPDGAAALLPHGGLLVADDGSRTHLAAPAVRPGVTVRRRAGRLHLAGTPR